jgi:thymidine kinase
VASVVSPEGWKAEVISAVEHWLTLIPQPSEQHRWKLIGKAHCGDEPGWLVLDRRGDPIKLDTLNDLCFAGDGGPDVATIYPIEVFRQVDGLLLLKEPPALPERSRMVWTKSMSIRLLTEKLLSGLRESTAAPIADAFATGRLPTSSMEEIGDPPGLIDAQVDAYRACLSAGVRLVWGPPGAGKTMVLARAIEDLINKGKRVLLVSTANIAVDNALHAVVKAMQPPHGTAVRVGPPQLAEVANNPSVHLGQLAAAASAEADHQLREIERQLAKLDEVDAEAARLSEQVRDFNPENYQLALWRIRNEKESEAFAQQIREAEKRREKFARHAVTKRATLQYAQNEWNRIAGAREELHKAEELRDQLHRLKIDLKSKQAAVTAAELRLTEARRWWVTRKARTIYERAAEELRNFEELATVQQPRLSELITEHLANAKPTTHDDVANVEAELQKACLAADEAERAEATIHSELQKLRDRYQAVRNRGLPTEADHKLVHRSQSADLPAKHKKLEHLKGQQRGLAAQRGKLEESHRYLVDRSRKLRQNAEKQLIEEASLVATTLARSRLHPALAAAHFDIVLIDEAGAATLAEVLLALCRATKSAVLFGDFLQLSPVQDKR